ncbi:dedicator of cytokinesis protein 4 CRK binding protein [Hyphopichia burtonii NRRL Y-1933]|uniref:Dedicator of cytokinesis protein 4 CRK binding protein n=1 Tax=Hyphopichia burtonii NRRL Y-1933 TaxID=984485 RepID=A0A1E4RTE4_9ASCO|nr:dedicator of cytokinesis protein 4 CRK binding protein [Hyphopichia burtonii NRRL Y-1933]ODV70508.1 dedicator of cytokinesis protein 4 CRK binding protein [Hyphopichia burtonii NRRL Y-1933]
MSWVPTNEFLRGKIIKPFLPFQKHPTLTNENFKNLYPGDDVYIFETKNEKWARGYTLTKPFPNDFTITSVNLDELPSLDIKIVIFPLKYVQVVENVPITKLEAEEVSVVAGNGELVPTIQDAEVAHKQALNADIGYDSNGKVKSLVPPLPVQNFDLGADLLKEIKHALNLLASHIFALYSIGEFRLFNKLSLVYTRLDETRIKLTNEILTTNEIQVAKETATFLLNKIPKKLASRSARLNEKSYDLDNRYTDISGYKAILARDAISGQLLSNDTAIPSRVALNQVLCALAPNFPINAHYHQESFSLKPSPNKKLYHEPPSHILVDFKSVSGSSAYQPPGFVGMIAYLYIRNSNRRLTEAFAVHASSVDDLVHVEKLRAALFRNIPSSEIDNGKVYLVAVLTEEIELPVKDASSPHVRRIKKGVAAGVTDITRIFSKNQGSLASGEPHQFSIRLFGSYKNQNKGNSKLNDELLNFDNNGWGELVDRIISGSSHGVAVNPRAEKLVISVKEFKHQFVANFNPIGATAPISRIKPIFFDPLAENYERIYLSMHKVSLLNSITKDDLLTFEVSAPNNDMITFAKASNEQERRMWQYVSVYPDEAVGEIVKINGVSSKNPTKKVPKDDYIILSLYINGLLAGEGKFMYKSGNKLVEYKKKSHSVEISSTTHKLPVALVEITTEYVGKVYNHDISIDNVFQFDRFFKGGQQGIDELAKTLIAFTKLDITQLVKFFPELLSSLYNIADVALKQPSSPGIEILQDNTFKAIVHLLDTLFGKQDQYMYMVETFTTRYTKLPHIGIFILNKISEIFSRAESNWNSMSRSLCRVVSLLLKLGISSINEINDLDAYLEALSSLFRSGSIFLSLDSPALINDQVLILEIIDYVLTFRVYLDQAKILKFIISFIDSIGTRGLGANEDVYGAKKNVVSKDHKIIISKLLLIHRLFNTTLVESADTRKFLISKSITWVMDVFLGPTDIDAVRLACSIMNAVCTLLWDDIVNKGVEDEIHLCFSLAKLLPAISRTFIKYNKFTRGNEYFKPKRTFTDLFPTDYPFKETSMDPIVNDESLVEVLVELSVIFTFIARIGKAASGNEGYSKILAAEAPEDDFFSNEKYLASNFGNEDILTLINGVKIIRQGKYFPEDKWLSLFSLIAEGCLVSLELIRPLLIKHYVPPMEDAELFDKAVWGSYLKTLLRLGTVAPVAIEHLSTVPRKACHLITGDMRDRISFLLMEAWDALAWDSDEEVMVRFNLKKFGGYQVEFISNDYETLQDLMLFALQRNESCQIVSVKMLWSIMVSEFLYLNDTMVDIERECLIGLHDIYYRTAYKPTVQEQKRFIERMKLTIRLDREDEAFGMVYNFIESLTGFLEVLNDLNSVPVGPEFDDDRTFHKLNINAYLKNANKPELFHSFINNMYEENINKGDFIQAALSLELLASTYSWNHHEILSATLKPKFPEQTSFERKETLYNMIATNYIKGNSLERATDTYNELLDSYSEHTYDLKSFAHVHRKLANLYIEMESSDKLSPSFFRVAFIGAGFPTNIRGKEQIYEGLPFEHITSIHERLLRLYPGARIISDDIQAQKLKEKVQTGRYLHVNAVEPINEISDKLFNTSIGVRQYARNKNLRFFTTMKKIPGATSVFDLWTEETTYETQMSFPTLMNRSDIKSVKTIKLSPLDNAIRTIVNKNNDLIQLESMINISFKEKADYTSLFNDLSRQLAGTVDSPVNGGVGQYRTFFNDPKYNGKEDYTYNIRLLKNAFNDLTIILNRCLHLHGKLISNNMKASHDVLVELFKKNFKEDIANLKISTDYENSIYNHSISHYPQSLQLENNSKRNISSNTTLNGGGSMIGGSIGSRLTRTTSRTSKASSNSNSSASGLVSPPSEQNSTTQNLNNSSFTFIGLKQKHSAVYWRDNVMRN